MKLEEKIADHHPDLGASSPEPSLRQMVRHYYRGHFTAGKADLLTAQYFEAIAQSLSSLCVGVKLEWEDCGKDDPFLIIARTPVGSYSIGEDDRDHFAVRDGDSLWEWWPGEDDAGKDTLEACQSACERDFASRISSCLNIRTEQEVVEEIATLAEQNAASNDCLRSDWTGWNDVAVWLRSQSNKEG